MPGIFDAFKPLDALSVGNILDYNKRGAVDEMAQALATKPDLTALLPDTLRSSLTNNKAAVLQWLCDLIPAPANRTGDWRLFFVRNFAQKWVKDKYPACADLAAAIARQVSVAKGLNANMSYYQENRNITVDASSPFKAEYDTHVAKRWQGVKRIGWRGDDRDPQVMFQAGFSPRVSVSSPIWRPQENNKDVDLDTTVCVARDIRGSAFFPLSKPVTLTWAYCVLIKEGWNTYYLQKKLAEERNQQVDTPQYRKTVWMFHEKCVNRVEPEDIVMAVQLERQIYDNKSPLTGIRFRLNDCTGKINGRVWSTLDTPQRHKVEDTVGEYLGTWYPSAAGQWLTYDGVVQK